MKIPGNSRSSFSHSLSLSFSLKDYLFMISYFFLLTLNNTNEVKTQRPTVLWLRGEKFVESLILLIWPYFKI